MDKKQKIQDAVIVSGETETNFIEERINAEIVKYKIADGAIDDLIKRAEGLEIVSLEDVDNYLKVKTIYREFVSTRTGLDKKRKEINKPFDEIVKGVNAEGKRLIARLSPEEDRLSAELEKFEAWKKEEDERIEREEAARLDARVSELKSAGLVYNNESMLYEIGDSISLDVVTIKKQSDFDFIALVEKIKAEKSRIDAKAEEERIAEEKRQEEIKAEADRQRKIAEDNERERLEIRAEKLEARSGKLLEMGFIDDLKNERFYYTNAGTLIESSYDKTAGMSLADFKVFCAGAGQTILETENEVKRIADEKKAAAEELERKNKIEALGFTFDGGFYVYKTISVPAEDYLSEDGFIDRYADLKNRVIEIENEEKKIAEEAKVEAEKKAEEARLEALPDFDKIERYIEEVNAIAVPQMKTDAGAHILAYFRESLKVAIDATSESIKTAK